MIYVNEPLLNGNEKKYLCECIDTKWISSEGPFVKKLEEGLAAFTGRKYGVAVSNGSVALDIAIATLKLKPGSEVIMPAFTIISCASAILRAGCIPVLVDCHPDEWNMTPEGVKNAITKKTAAIMVVHIYGLPVDMDPILNIAKERNLKIIEDAAEQLGQTYKNRPCGKMGNLSTLSFYPNKHITTGEGGMILTDDHELAERSKALRNLCFGKKRFVHEELGWNGRMSNLQAAVGVAQLEKINNTLKRKRSIGGYYSEKLKTFQEFQIPFSKTDFAENIYWVFGVVLRSMETRDASWAIEKLKNRGIECRPFFLPMHQQPIFKKMGLFKSQRFPNAERIGKYGFYLPSGVALTKNQQRKVVNELINIVIGRE